jgi:ribulose-bisphosphate carboxylase small chain
MSEMQEYRSSLSDPASRKFETFSYLPAMDKAQIKKQVAYIVGKGWNAAIEHTEPENAFGHYWYMWWARRRPAIRPIRAITCA